MSLQQLKQQHPDLYQQVYERGVRAEKNRQYRKRTEAEIREAVRMSFELEKFAERPPF
ncbi:MAG TPA: hypothetical protein VE860_05755 [Chthoniobacterales bacterium]|nr:hypothetical protein [Chthoniobacterales bacterium]